MSPSPDAPRAAGRNSRRSGISLALLDDLEACIDRPGVDAVILTTPSDQHHDQTVLALSKGKHVQVEIPMALNLADSKHMLDEAKKAGKR